MKNFIQKGEALTIVAGGTITSGQPVLINELFGVAQDSVASGESYVLNTLGVFDLPKAATVTPAVGEEAFYNSGAGTVTNASAEGLFKIGVFTRAALAGDATCRVRLDGVSVSAVPAA